MPTGTEPELEQLASTLEDFCAWMESLPARDARPREWGPHEVLAHLVYHHEGYLSSARAVLAGKAPRLPAGKFREINARAVEALRDVPVTVLTGRLRAANRALSRLARENDPGAIAFRIKEGSKLWPLADLIPAVEAHLRNHLAKLKMEAKGK